MFNANMNPGARIPRNAIRVWQSDATIARLSGRELTISLLRCLPAERTNAVHPKDWPSETVIGDGSGFRSVRVMSPAARAEENEALARMTNALG